MIPSKNEKLINPDKNNLTDFLSNHFDSEGLSMKEALCTLATLVCKTMTTEDSWTISILPDGKVYTTINPTNRRTITIKDSRKGPRSKGSVNRYIKINIDTMERRQ